MPLPVGNNHLRAITATSCHIQEYVGPTLPAAFVKTSQAFIFLTTTSSSSQVLG